MEHLGQKIRIPPKQDVRGWNRLWQGLAEIRYRYLLQKRTWIAREIHDMEKFIARLERRPLDKSRSKLIRMLKRRLALLQDEKLR
jgi:predicted RNase H-like nuclease (RuvC/YqgF family)